MGSLFRMSLWAAILLPVAAGPAYAGKRLMFWNVTGQKITHLYLAPAGSTAWGADQCANDPDGAVDSDERMPVAVAPGHYDVKVTQQSGLTCVVHNVDVKGTGPYAFSVSEGDLAGCAK